MISSSQLIQKIPDPVLYDSIQFYDQQNLIKYTDCWEISLLRFLHLVFGQNGTISQQKLTKFMDLDSWHCIQLIEYFKQNPTYEFKQKFYKSQEGFLIRSLWCQFLNKTKILNLKHDGKYQVKATIPNLIKFFSFYFPLLKIAQQKPMTINLIESKQLFKNYQQILKQIYQQLSTVSQVKFYLKKLTIDINLQMDYLFFSTVQQISIGNQNNIHLLEWEIYQYYHLGKDTSLGQRMTGHSDYRYNTKFKRNQSSV